VSTAHDLLYAEPAAPVLRLVPATPLDFDDAVKRVRPRLHRYAIRRLGDSHEAEELVQEALLRAYTHREQLLTEEDLSAWTTVVTGRLVIDRLRVRGRSTSVADVPEGTRVGRDTADVARKALRKEYETRGGTLPVGGLAVLAPWITGLTLAHKLRKAATRITAPAALGAIGITALGGLVLSPFGLDPSTGGAHYSPTQAIVTSVSTRTDLPAHRIQLPAHAPASAAAHRVTAAPTTAGMGPGALGTALQHRVENLCTTSSADQAGAGGSECTPAERNTWVYVPLPTSVAGQRQVGLDVGVKSGPHPVSCADLPTNPVIQCSSQGAQK
jgi:RNA polymerase sigma factor (sigma-70 family)